MKLEEQDITRIVVALRLCEAELLSEHLNFGDKENALDHSTALRLVDNLRKDGVIR
jgi:hypothetical protein